MTAWDVRYSNTYLVASLMPPTPFACSSKAQKWKVLSMCVQLLSPYWDTFWEFGPVLATFSGISSHTKQGTWTEHVYKKGKGGVSRRGLGHQSVVKMCPKLIVNETWCKKSTGWHCFLKGAILAHVLFTKVMPQNIKRQYTAREWGTITQIRKKWNKSHSVPNFVSVFEPCCTMCGLFECLGCFFMRKKTWRKLMLFQKT